MFKINFTSYGCFQRVHKVPHTTVLEIVTKFSFLITEKKCSLYFWCNPKLITIWAYWNNSLSAFLWVPYLINILLLDFSHCFTVPLNRINCFMTEKINIKTVQSFEFITITFSQLLKGNHNNSHKWQESPNHHSIFLRKHILVH